MTQYISPPPQNPLTKIIAAVIAAFVLIGAFMIGIAALVVVACVGLVVGIAIWLRVAWIKRRLRKSGVVFDAPVDMSREPGQVIDAEYTVVSDKKDQSEK
ncbi:MAG: hypothetical protein GY732_05950 [Gammaproteobacteria bacterium]|nr:hypothetical protein [Gammaproteobacteria bacterium]